MNDQTITAMAEKLGTTPEHLWEILLKQAPVSGYIDIAVIVLWTVLILLWLWYLIKKTTPPKNSYMTLEPDWSPGSSVMAWRLTLVGIFIYLLITGVTLSTVVSSILNPEYWALKQILNTCS